MSIEKLQEALVVGYAEEYGKIVYDSGWEQDGKYQHCTTVLHISDDDLKSEGYEGWEAGYYRIVQARAGGYYSDYDYLDPEIEKVEPYEEVVTVRRWRPVSERI